MSITQNKADQRVYTIEEVGLNAVTLAAERTSNSINLAGVRELAIYIALTAGGSATRVDCAIDFTPEGLNGETISSTSWYKGQAISVTSGAGTLSEFVAQKTVVAASGANKWEIRLTDLNAAFCRLRISAGAGGASASDTVIVTVITKS